MYIPKPILYLTLLTTLVNGYFWRDYNGTIPHDAILGHYGRYIGQVNVGEDGLLPVTIYPNQREAVGELRGRRVYKKHIKILCKYSGEIVYWRYVDVNKIKRSDDIHLAVGGYERSVTFYIGRMFHEHEWKISKVFPPGFSNKGLFVWPKQGSTVEKFEYIEVLHNKIRQVP